MPTKCAFVSHHTWLCLIPHSLADLLPDLPEGSWIMLICRDHENYFLCTCLHSGRNPQSYFPKNFCIHCVSGECKTQMDRFLTLFTELLQFPLIEPLLLSLACRASAKLFPPRQKLVFPSIKPILKCGLVYVVHI